MHSQREMARGSERHSWRYSLEKAVGGEDPYSESGCLQVSSEAVTHREEKECPVFRARLLAPNGIGGQARK